MSDGTPPQDRPERGLPGVAGVLARALARVNGWILGASMLALVAAALVLTASVLMRYFLKEPTEWQDETSVFLLVGAVFMCGAYVQSYRGHVAIEALTGLLPARVNRARLVAVDVVSLAFSAFFAWKSWTLLREALVDHQTTSSSWAPPLWIPYSLMATGHDAARAADPPADPHARVRGGARAVSVAGVGILYGAATLLVMFAGVPIAFALGSVAVTFMYFFMPGAALDTVTQNVYEEMASITLLSIPLFILKGAAIGKSRAGADLYSAIHVWLRKDPGRPRHRQRLRLRPLRRHGGVEPGDRVGHRRAPASRRCGPAATRRGFAAGIIAAGGTLGILLPPVDHHDPLLGGLGAVARPAVPRRGHARGCCSSCCSPATRRLATSSEYRAAMATYHRTGVKAAHLEERTSRSARSSARCRAPALRAAARSASWWRSTAGTPPRRRPPASAPSWPCC